MLRRLTVKGFKSLAEVEVDLPLLTVFFGPNAAGKSNLLDAIQALSRIGTSRTLAEALTEPIRGYPIEAFAFPRRGLSALLNSERAEFTLGAYISTLRERYRYRITVGIQPTSGSLTNRDENFKIIKRTPGRPPASMIETVRGQIRLRRKGKAPRPREDPGQAHYAVLSDPRLADPDYGPIERCRTELSGWRTYYLDPRIAMRSAKPPADVRDIGVLGEDIAPFLYRLRAENPPKHFEAVKRTLRSLIPSVDDLTVDLDKRRGTLDIQVRQDGIDFSSRIISEGTLRVLALCSIAVNPWMVNPWRGGLIAFEEPENGVHPRRIELIAQLLASLALKQGRQVVVTTHSPLFCDAVLKLARSNRSRVALFNVRRGINGTEVHKFNVTDPLFQDHEITKALTSGTEDGLFESLLLRGMFNE